MTISKKYRVDPGVEGMTFGCDPEMFIVNGEGHAVCPTFIPGTKEEPFKVDGGAIQRDGMAAEINIDPVDNYQDWHDKIKAVVNEVQKRLPSGHKISFQPSMKFTEEEWNKAPDDAKEMGCEPDYNAWTMDMNPSPDADKLPRVRAAGGHIHFGWTKGEDVTNLDHVTDCCDLAKMLDWCLALWACRIDKDNVRRQLYGKAGSIRVKDYGVEYRVLSNFWLKDDNHMLTTWNRTMRAINRMSKDFYPGNVGLRGNNPTSKFTFNDRVIASVNSGSIDNYLAEHFYRPIITI